MKLTLAEIDFPSGTRRYSFQGVRAPAAFYKDQLLSVGEIAREVPLLAGPRNIGNIRITLSNADKEFSKLKATDAFRNREVRVKFGEDSGGVAALTTVFTGKITRWEISSGQLGLEVRDSAYDKLQQRLAATLKVLNTTDFPNMPATQSQELIPVIYGIVENESGHNDGPVPAYLVDPAQGQSKYRYVLAQSPVKQVRAVYRYGQKLAASAYTVVTVSGLTYLDFTSDQRANSDPQAKDFSPVIISAGLIHRWKMDEGSGTAIDDDQGVSDGTLTGGVWKTGHQKNYLDFSAGGNINIGNDSSLNLAGDFTICVWIDPRNWQNSTDDFYLVNGDDTLNVRGWGFFIRKDDRLPAFRTNQSGANQLSFPGEGPAWFLGSTDGSFFMLSVVRSGSSMKFYFSDFELRLGSLGQSQSHSNPVAPSNPVRISDTTKPFFGGIAHVRIYNTALAQADITRLKNLPFKALLDLDRIEITAAVDGVPDANNVVIENPVGQLEHFLTNYAGLVAGDLNSPKFDSAEAEAGGLGYKGAFALVNRNSTFEEVTDRFSETFGLAFYLDRSGKYAVSLPAAVDLGDVPGIPKVTDENDILRNSFVMRPVEEAASKMQYNHQWHWVREFFEQQDKDLSDAAEQANLGQEIRSNVNLWFTRNTGTASGVARDRLSWMKEGTLLAEFELPISQFSMDLLDVRRLTHYQGLDSAGAGFLDDIFRVLGIRLLLQPRTMRVRILAVKIDAESNVWLPYIKINHGERFGDRLSPEGSPWGQIYPFPFGDMSIGKVVNDPLFWALGRGGE